MGYGRLEPSDPVGGPSRLHPNQPEQPASSPQPPSRRNKIILLSVLSIALLVASAASAAVLIGLRTRASGQSGSSVHRTPTRAISKTCSRTRFPDLCVNSLLDFPGSTKASERDLVHISLNMTLQHLSKAVYSSSGISYLQMEPRVRLAFDDCLELLEDSVDALSRALLSIGGEQLSGAAASTNDVLTWLSAALTNQDTCTEGLADLSGPVKDQMAARLKDLAELLSNCLAIFSGSDTNDFSGVPIQNRRRLMESDISEENAGGLPRWLGERERKLLGLPVSGIQADIVVSKDGNGTYKTIAEAIKKAPEHSSRRTIIYVRAGR
jgi:pectinesterase inhibitor-like protein